MTPQNTDAGELHPRLTEEILRELEGMGEVVTLSDGQILFQEGDTDYPFYAVLDGKVRITKQFGPDQRVLAVYPQGGFVGDISMMTGGPSGATARAQGLTRVVRIPAEKFRKLAADCTPMVQTVLSAMANRAQDVEAQTRQQEKMTALGKMAAGLAHELNNPAAAAKRAAGQLREAVEQLQTQAVRCDCRMTAAQRDRVMKLSRRLASNGGRLELDPVERSDREEETASWLEEHGIRDGWELSSALAGSGLTTEDLDELHEGMHGESLEAALQWLRTGLEVRELAGDVEASTMRISDLVRVMKEYSYMDQDAFQELDIHKGLESTLRLFGYRLRGSVELVRDYSADVPKICAYGNELNQVWTNLIDNALDAMNGQGRLTVRTAPDDDGVLVEIIDTGPGIPEDIQERIFEPFFTTKGVGAGTGLGLDISYRIIANRHGGTLRVSSVPGETKFQIRLPRQPPRQEA